ncbi:MAG: hypothetical protein N2319_12305 [Candidatus Kapabacteria bacterium]|jgi:photosystem II stability/assembly factor-like uncharacterized protein|nr:hypothetical protein [Candidatus Kapabacteria bacterium]
MFKIAIVLLIIFCTYIGNALPDTFNKIDFYRINSDFNGSVYNGSILLVYGNGGVILKSSDIGNNWEQINLNDNLNIINMIYTDNQFVGLSDRNEFIFSKDNGISWESKSTNPGFQIYKMIFYNDNYYCMGSDKILVYDKKYQKIEEYQIKVDTNYYSFALFKNKILYTAKKGLIKSIDLNNKQESFIDLKNYGICVDCSLPIELQADNQFAYFRHNLILYGYDGNSINHIHSPNAKGIYCLKNNEIYQIYNVNFSDYKLDSLYFVKVNKQTKGSISIKSKINDRYISGLVFTDVKFINDKTIVAVGKDKLIYMSYNSGADWELKSHLNNLNYITRFDAQSSTQIQPYLKFNKSNDGGVTWLSQKNYNKYFSNALFGYLYSYGIGYFLNKNNGFYFLSSSTENFNIAYTNDNCENVSLQQNESMGYDKSKDLRCISYKDTALIMLPGIFKSNCYSILFRLGNEFNEINRTVLDSTWLLFIDKLENNSIIAISTNYKYPYKKGSRTYFDSIFSSVIISKDGGYTWEKEFDFNMNGFESKIRHYTISRINNDLFFHYVELNEDSVMKASIYRYKISEKTLEKIFSDDYYDPPMPGVVKIGEYYYFITMRVLSNGTEFNVYENRDFNNNPKNWTKISPFDRYSIQNMESFNDSLYKIIAYDSLFKKMVVWFNKPDIQTDVDNQINNEYNSIYISNPIPNPANQYVRFKIYWDSALEPSLFRFEALNLVGAVISENEKFDFHIINNHSGELIWYPGQLTSGIYFLNVKLGSSNKYIKVVLN